MIIARLISLSFILLASNLLAIDIVQIDVGNKINFTGVLNMAANDNVITNTHGTDMAIALESELKLQRSKPVYAKQLYWDYYHNSRQTLLKALSNALKENTKVLSLSYGGNVGDRLEESILIAHYLNDTVIVAAAGNDGGGRQYYPANYKNPCIVSVGTTIHGRRTMYSNHADVYLEYNKIDPTGTSASTARMAGIVLQLRRNNPNLTCEKIVLTVKMLYGKIVQ